MKLKEAPITHSPHAFVPKMHYTEQEEAELYKTKIDGTFKPYTAIDVITKVFHRDMEDDLAGALGKEIHTVCREDGAWNIGGIRVSNLRYIRPESLFGQPWDDFRVEIAVEATIKTEEVKVGNSVLKNTNTNRCRFWLSYSFNLTPCKLTCKFCGVIREEKDTMLARHPDAIHMDKYLIPVLTTKDYIALADRILAEHYKEAVNRDIPIDAELLVKRMGKKLVVGNFSEHSALGEYFFDFGVVDMVDSKTGERKSQRIKPGTILCNANGCVDNRGFINEGSKNVTITHEGSHTYLHSEHFMLQKMHGHAYSSYVCKRVWDRNSDFKGSTIDHMEIEANKLPGYILIRETTGRRHA